MVNSPRLRLVVSGDEPPAPRAALRLRWPRDKVIGAILVLVGAVLGIAIWGGRIGHGEATLLGYGSIGAVLILLDLRRGGPIDPSRALKLGLAFVVVAIGVLSWAAPDHDDMSPSVKLLFLLVVFWLINRLDRANL